MGRKFCRLGICFVLAFFIGSGDGRAQERIRLAYSAISGAMLTPWVGVEAGIFKKNGLEVQLIYIAGGSTAAAALIGGDVQISLASGDGVVRGRLQGIDLISFADMTSTLVFSLMVQTEVSAPDDLKGKKLGITRFGTSSHAALVAGLKRLRINLSDVTVLQMGGIPQVLAGLESGAISGGILSAPTNIKGKKLGMKELLDIGTLKIPFQMNTFIARGDFIRRNPESMRRLVQAIIESIHKIKADQAFATKVLAKYTKIEDPEILAETYRMFAVRYLSRAPYPSEEAVKQRLAEIAIQDQRAASANAKDFIDPRWIKELEDSGFIARLYNQ